MAKHFFLCAAFFAWTGLVITASSAQANVGVPAGARISSGALGTVEMPQASPTQPMLPSDSSATVASPSPAVALPATSAVATPTSSLPVQGATAAQAAVDEGYRLGVGDKLRVTVYGEPDLSGEYEVSSTGTVALPLVGEVPALNLGLHEFEKAAASRLADGYLQNPRVSAQITNYRPFFILGEVAKPGSYPYVNGMTILNAVALAGGYTYRADRSDVHVTHANDPSKKEERIKEEAMVKPGDIIRVPERFF